MKNRNLKKLTLKQLEALAIERFGPGAFMLAEVESEKSALHSREPWLKLLERPVTANDLLRLASHRSWQQSINP